MTRRPIFLICLILLSLAVLPGARNRAEERDWRLLETSAEGDDPRDTLDSARSYLNEHPDGEHALEARLIAGRSAYDLQLWDAARNYLESYLELGGRDDLDEVKLLLGLVTFKKDPGSARAQLSSLVRSTDDPSIARRASRELVAQLLFDGDWRVALRSQQDLLERGWFTVEEDLAQSRKAIEAARREYKGKGRAWNEKAWSKLEGLFDEPLVRGLVAALALEDQGQLTDSPDTETARRAWAARYPEHPLASWVPGAEEYAAVVEDVNADKVGLLIPSSGRYAAPGALVKRGVDLALQHAAEAGWAQVDLEVVDTMGDPARAEEALRALSTEAKAIAVLGPLLTAEAEVVVPVSTELATPMVSLVQKPGLGADHPYAFNAWVHPESQVRALVDHAVNRMGLTKFAIAYPNKESAGELAGLFWEAVEDQGGSVVAVESYDAKETDFRETGRRLKGDFYGGGAGGEADSQLPFLTGRRKPHLGTTLEPGVDFQAVFVPDNYNRVSMLAPGFIFEEINLGGHIDKKPSVVLLGGSALNHPDLVNRGGDYIDGTVLVDGFVLGSDDASVHDFVNAYHAAYAGADPTVLEASAYDATLFLLQILSEGVTTRRELLQRLTLATPAVTVTGARGFDPGGSMSHAMKVLQVRKGAIVQVFPEPGPAAPISPVAPTGGE